MSRDGKTETWIGAGSPVGPVRLDDRFREWDRAEGEVLEVSERVRVAQRRPSPLSEWENVLDWRRERTYAGPQPTPISPAAVIWERSAESKRLLNRTGTWAAVYEVRSRMSRLSMK